MSMMHNKYAAFCTHCNTRVQINSGWLLKLNRTTRTRLGIIRNSNINYAVFHTECYDKIIGEWRHAKITRSTRD